MRGTATQRARAFRSVKRICYAGLDSITLRAEAGRRLSRVVPADAWTMATLDPETALFTHAVSRGVPPALAGTWMRHMYPLDEADSIIRQSRASLAVTTEASPFATALVRSSGFAHEMRTILSAKGALWGFCCMLRAPGTAAFGRREVEFMRRLAPHLAAGLRSAALLEVAGTPEAPGGAGASSGPLAGAPGVLVLDASGAVCLRNAAAAVWLEDLADIGMGRRAVPSAVAGAVARVLRLQQEETPGSPLSAVLRARGRSGRWCVLEASVSEPDAAGRSSVIVLVKPAAQGEVAAILTRLYGLTPRERETLARVARGESTKEIAAALGLSPYTVQEYVGKACEKVGVRSRKALLAKLFFDGYAPALLAGGHVEVDGCG